MYKEYNLLKIEIEKACCAKGNANTRWPGVSRVSNLPIKKIGSITALLLLRLFLFFIRISSIVT